MNRVKAIFPRVILLKLLPESSFLNRIAKETVKSHSFFCYTLFSRTPLHKWHISTKVKIDLSVDKYVLLTKHDISMLDIVRVLYFFAF